VPDLVVYDATLACDMPLVLTAQSLCNAIAHVASAASTGSTDTQPARDAFKALEELLVAPRDLDARERAARAASACAAILERGKAGMQHALAHQLGGALNLDHAAVHSILLPHFLAWSKVNIGIEPAQIQDVLVRAGAPTKLSELGVNAAAVGGALATRPDLPAQIAFAAQ
jgi:maleylacetate reductase